MALQRVHVTLAVDRAGIVGDDGETHQGLFDAAFLNTVPVSYTHLVGIAFGLVMLPWELYLLGLGLILVPLLAMEISKACGLIKHQH